MRHEEATTWPSWALVMWTVIFIGICGPALIAGALDEENRPLFIIVAVLVVPGMVAHIVATGIVLWERRTRRSA